MRYGFCESPAAGCRFGHPCHPFTLSSHRPNTPCASLDPLRTSGEFAQKRPFPPPELRKAPATAAAQGPPAPSAAQSHVPPWPFRVPRRPIVGQIGPAVGQSVSFVVLDFQNPCKTSRVPVRLAAQTPRGPCNPPPADRAGHRHGTLPTNVARNDPTLVYPSPIPYHSAPSGNADIAGTELETRGNLPCRWIVVSRAPARWSVTATS
jgi:hypothetical protein